MCQLIANIIILSTFTINIFIQVAVTEMLTVLTKTENTAANVNGVTFNEDMNALVSEVRI